MTSRTGGVWEPHPVRPIDRIDACIAIAVFVLSWAVAALYLPAFRAGGGTPQFYQTSFAPAVMWACGRGYQNVDAAAIPPLDDFLSTRSDRFTCANLPAQVTPVPLGLMPSVCRYLMLATAGVWRVTRVSWTTVDLLLSAMFATAIATMLLALRFVAGRTLAVIGVGFWALSPMHLANLPHLRDYSKTPFFALTALATAIVVVERRGIRLLLTGGALGLALGIGFGMRTDVILYFIPFMAALFFAGPRPWREQLGAKAGAAALSVALFAIVASPLFGVYGNSDGLSKIALLGLTTPFDRPLGLRPAPYDFGSQYNDSYVASEVYGDWQRRHDGANSREPSSALFADLSRDYYAALIRMFPGDILTRASGSVVQTLNLPFSMAYVAPWGVTHRTLVRLFELRSKLMYLLIGTGPSVAILLLWLIGLSRARDSLVAAGVLLFLAVCPVIQFQDRHTFHLEVVVISLFVWLASLVVRSARQLPGGPRPQGLALARSAGVIAGVIGWSIVIVLTGRLVQTPRATALLDRYDKAAVDALPLTAGPSGDGRIRLSADVFAAAPSPRVQQAFLVADVSTALCPHAPDALTIRYVQPRSGTTIEYAAATTVALPATTDRRGPMRVFFPAYTLEAARFAALEVAPGAEACVRLGRVLGVDSEMWLDATLAPGWRERPVYQRLDIRLLFPARIWLTIANRLPSFAAMG